MIARSIRHLVCLFAIGFLPHLVAAQPPSARTQVILRPVPWAWYDPYYAITSRVYAQAELVRAQGDVAVDFAQARVLHAEAVDKELDNWVKYVRTYWDRKLIREEKLLDLENLSQIRKDQRLNREKYRNSRAWDRLKNHPELSQVGEGKALNFLLHRLAGTALAYDFVRQNRESGRDMLTELKLSPDQLHGLNLRQKGRGGAQLVFRADGSSGLDLEWWPYLLRWDEFEAYRSAFEKVRSEVIAQVDGGGTASVATLQQLETALGELSREFYRVFAKEELRKATFAEFSQYRASELFLRQLDHEVVRFQNTGNVDLLRAQRGYVAARDGDDLLGLLTYMARNGVEFAPASPGDEPAYYTVFAMMRDLYVTVAGEDEGIRPKARGGSAS